MSYSGSDDLPLYDMCGRPYPPYWPDGFTAPWPVTGPLMEADGRTPADQRDNFSLCLSCIQDLVLSAHLRRGARALAIRSRDRWLASQRLLSQVKAIALDAA